MSEGAQVFRRKGDLPRALACYSRYFSSAPVGLTDRFHAKAWKVPQPAGALSGVWSLEEFGV